VLAHFIVSDDVERSRRFYTEVLGGRVAFSGPGGLTYVALSNTWIIINVGGGPTDDKPAVTLETPRDPDRVSSFLNIRVKDIQAVYAEWSARGAQFLTPPKQHQYETRCYIRDPDGHLIEVGQTTDPDGDWSPAHWPSSTPLFAGPAVVGTPESGNGSQFAVQHLAGPGPRQCARERDDPRDLVAREFSPAALLDF
jgi:catechol 2,3-dioxygenase-like lactoylglutathione lyase family enzyme